MLQLDYAYTRYAHRRGRPPYISGFVFVFILHAILINVLIDALGKVDTPVKRGPFTARVIEPDKEITPLPPPPAPVIDRSLPVDTPIVQEVIIAPTESPRNSITEPVRTPAKPTETTVPISEIPPRVVASTQTGPTYPAISRWLREEGSVRLRLTIGIDGSVIDASVVSSSGFQRLDEAAMRWVRRNWRYEPAMRGDMPIEATSEVTLTFRLE